MALTDPYKKLHPKQLNRRLHKEHRLRTTGLHLHLIKFFFKLTGLYNRAYKEGMQLESHENTIYLDNLPQAFSGFRILHLSDLHTDHSAHLTPKLKPFLKNLSYDLCVITGDFYTNHSKMPRKQALQSLQSLQSYLPDIKTQTLAVLGNHDPIQLVPDLETMGIQVLLNEHTFIEKNNQKLFIAGIDDPIYYQAHEIQKAAKHIPKEACSILLSHAPTIFAEAEKAHFNLMLAGHSHGGQICLPGNIPVLNNTECPRRMISGLWRYRTLQGYTSRGVGMCGLPLRLNCPPEIVIHTLKNDPKNT